MSENEIYEFDPVDTAMPHNPFSALQEASKAADHTEALKPFAVCSLCDTATIISQDMGDVMIVCGSEDCGHTLYWFNPLDEEDMEGAAEFWKVGPIHCPECDGDGFVGDPSLVGDDEFDDECPACETLGEVSVLEYRDWLNVDRSPLQRVADVLAKDFT